MARSSSRSVAAGRLPQGRRVRRRRVSPARQISRWLFVGYAAALLLWPVYQSSGTPRAFGVCEVNAPVELWLQGAFGYEIAIYGLLTTIGAGMFLRPKILQASVLAGLVAVGVEVLEFTLNSGVCRLRDLVPAFIGIAMAVGVHTAMRTATPPTPGKVKKVRKVRKGPRRSWVSM